MSVTETKPDPLHTGTDHGIEWAAAMEYTLEETASRIAPVGDPAFKSRYEVLIGTTPETAGLWVRLDGAGFVVPLADARLSLTFADNAPLRMDLRDPEAAARLDARLQGAWNEMRRMIAQNRVTLGLPPEAAE